MKLNTTNIKDYFKNNKLKLLKLSTFSIFVIFSLVFLNTIRKTDSNTIDSSIIKFPIASIGTTNNLSFKNDELEPIKAAFVILVRNEELNGWLSSMEQLEFRFNKRFNYPYVFLNDKNFTEEFKQSVKDRTKARIKFGLIPKEHWGYPDFIDKFKAAKNREDSKHLDYGSSESYRHMCRFESGFFFRHPVLNEFEYYWRVEPDIEFLCDIDPDPFRYIKENNIKYSFTIALREEIKTIPTLWKTVWDFIDTNGLRSTLPKDNALDWISNDNGKTYNRCHYWSNFEIASLDLWRSPEYIKFFDYLDKSGGFFYERWGDAPVHTIYAALFLSREQIHFFNDIGYIHDGVIHCPKEVGIREKCHCDAGYRVVTHNEEHSCIPSWIKLINRKNLFSKFP